MRGRLWAGFEGEDSAWVTAAVRATAVDARSSLYALV